jgi:hypothetical protein
LFLKFITLKSANLNQLKMKNIYAILFATLLMSASYAQTNSGTPYNTNRPLFRPTSTPAKPASESRTVSQFITDYDYSDSISEVNIAGNLYDTRYAWDFNMNYVPTDTSQKYYEVVFDSIIDSYNQISYDRTQLQSIMMDSLYIVIGQENNSGLDDTLIVKLMGVAANRIPNNTILWSDTTIISAGAPLGTDWLTFHVLSIPVGYSYPSTTTRVAVKVEYSGDKLDTAGFLAGFGYNGTCTSGLEIAYDTYMNPVPYNPSAASFPNGFNANSYVWFTPFNGGALYPATNNYIFYNCDATSGYQPGSDAFNLWQNINMFAFFTLDSLVGINEQTANGMTLLQNSPNPFNNETVIKYGLKKASNVTIEVSDLAGRVISVIDEGSRGAGTYSTSFNAGKLAAGTYFYTLKTENGSITNRMVISTKK